MSSVQPPPGDPRIALRKALADLLANHPNHTALSAWERHCLGQALTLLRYGYYEPARLKIEMILEPPIPLPVFPLPRPLTLEDVRRAMTQL